jgi:crotonobetaine/carnitine-CoA ligase
MPRPAASDFDDTPPPYIAVDFPWLPLREQTLPALLERQATVFGEKPLLRTDSIERSFRDMRDAAAAHAGAFSAAGVAPGDRVVIMSENRVEVLDVLLGCAWLGAIAVPINTALRGEQLAHVLENSGARVLTVEAQLIPYVDYVAPSLSTLERVWVLGDREIVGAAYPCDPLPTPREAVQPHAAGPGDTAIILYTSGTTGPSKGVLCPHAQLYRMAALEAALLGTQVDDVFYTCLPLFHTNALTSFFKALATGATFVLGPRFSASAFWQRIIEADATVTYLLGAMVQILFKRPASAEDRAHRVRVALAPATPAGLFEPFFDRFGIRLLDGWASTETNIVVFHPLEAARPGTMGKLVEGFEAKIVDEDDLELPDGTPGEFVVRNQEPFSFSTGYFGLPDKTVEAWRNLWFHTGDRVVREADGTFRFVDRIKDAIRRRGENISSYEVERVLAAHPDVEAAAVIPVPSELGEDEVMACVVLRAQAQLDPIDLIRFCEPQLAYFAIPRYVDFLPELPLTASNKIEKYRLRERGVTSTTWDRERAGYVLSR